MATREIVLRHVFQIAKQHLSVQFPSNAGDDAKLNDYGFDSVAYVALISALEEEVGFIPEAILEGASFPKTVGEFVAMYEHVPQAHEI
jgi:acyl carrier protein